MKEGIGIGTLSGLIASLCCLGPVVIFLLGLSSVFGLTGLCMIEFRPVFITLGVVTLVSGTVLWLRKEEGSCDVNAAAKNKEMIAVSIVVMVVSYFAFLEFLVPFLKSNFIVAATCTM
ncbi:MAG: hypothetical protein ABEJ72_02785 [Candidatus Aenigmatarchaeota archaeon]